MIPWCQFTPLQAETQGKPGALSHSSDRNTWPCSTHARKLLWASRPHYNLTPSVRGQAPTAHTTKIPSKSQAEGHGSHCCHTPALEDGAQGSAPGACPKYPSVPAQGLVA